MRDLRHLVLLLALCAGVALSGGSLLLALERSGSLRALSGASHAALVGAQALALLAGLLALGRYLRRGGQDARNARTSLRTGLHVLALGTLIYLVCIQPYKPRDLFLFWGLGAGAFALIVLLGPGLARRLPRALLGGIDRSLTRLWLAVLCAELALWALSAVSSAPVFVRLNDPADVMARHRLEPGSSFYGFRVNSRGFNDEEFDAGHEGPLVATIGDSFSVGAVPHPFHYTTVCEERLPGLQIANVGIASCGPVEYLRLLAEEALPLRPDAVVIALFIGNDIGDARRFRPRYPLVRRWFDRDEWLLHAVPRRLLALARAELELPSASGNLTERGDYVRSFPWLADPLLERPSFSREHFLALESGRALSICLRGGEAGYEPLFAVLDEIRATAGATPLYFLLIPDEFQVDDELWAAVEERARAIGALDRDQPQRIVGAWLAEHALPFLDLLPVLRAAPPLADGRRHLYHLRDTHLNARGNQVAGEALATFLAHPGRLTDEQ